jgi:hypothetical protein
MTFEEAMVVAKGNREAALFLCDWDAFCGLLDDVYDEPGKVGDERLVLVLLNLLGDLCNGGWARDNAPRLFPLMVAGANAWLDANRLAATSPVLRERVASDVLKSQYADMERVVAYLCGGHGHMREVSAGRTFDWDVEVEAEGTRGKGAAGTKTFEEG